MNSFSNDTVLLIDACYSGSNEGPKEVGGVFQGLFKHNSMRIYASLAHETAKEIDYKNEYFKQYLPFYSEVLGLSDLSGNGYFTAMVGLFFAEYKLGAEENIDFKKIVSYVSNKGREYVEYLTKAGTKTQNSVLLMESANRLNQQPKVLPLKEEVSFNDESHNFFVIQKILSKAQYWKTGNFYSITPSFYYVLTMGDLKDILGAAIMPLVSLDYNYNLNSGVFGIGITSGYHTVKTQSLYTKQYTMNSIPLSLHARYISKLDIPIFFSTDINLGFMFQSLKYADSLNAGKNANTTASYFSGGLGIGFNLFQNLAVSINGNLLYILEQGGNYLGLASGIGLILFF